jgi:RNA-directed DNA polymerase
MSNEGSVMELEQRDRVRRCADRSTEETQEETMNTTKAFHIPKELVWQGYKRVKANAGAAGVDGQSLATFEKNLKDNLYKLWNRLSSGSYFPPPVKAVAIPKKTGGERVLGVPTVGDRIAQMVIKLAVEPYIEPHFLADSYGYRPGKSALDAIDVTRKRCWKYDWVLEFDIKGLFDNLSHDLLLKAVRHHTQCKWILLYIERWLKAPLQMPDGTQIPRTKGTPQGGVVSPVLANLFLHYAFDLWITREFPDNPWCRYADDGLVHCRTEVEAQKIMQALGERYKECGLEMHPSKTNIIYCKDNARKGKYPRVSFTFLGYTFQPRKVKNPRSGNLFIGFTPAVSREAQKSMRQEIRKFRHRSDFNLEKLAGLYNPQLRGWTKYFGRFYPSAMYIVYRHFNQTLVAWAMRKYKPLRQHKTRASRFLLRIAQNKPKLFYHWSIGRMGTFA